MLRGAPTDGFGADEPTGPAAEADGGRRPRPTPGGGGATPPADPGGDFKKPALLPLPPPIEGRRLEALSPTAVNEAAVAILNGTGDADRGVE